MWVASATNRLWDSDQKKKINFWTADCPWTSPAPALLRVAARAAAVPLCAACHCCLQKLTQRVGMNTSEYQQARTPILFFNATRKLRPATPTVVSAARRPAPRCMVRRHIAMRRRQGRACPCRQCYLSSCILNSKLTVLPTAERIASRSCHLCACLGYACCWW